MVSAYGSVELIDYGGVSPFGRVKQFTEWYDRGYWNAGSRTGDISYDLFSFAVMCIGLLDEKSLREASCQLPQTRSVADLRWCAKKPRVQAIRCVAEQGFVGRFRGFTGSVERVEKTNI